MSIDRLPASITADLSLFPGGERLVAEHQAELPQKNDLCGAFWGCLALRQQGYDRTPDDGDVLDQDSVGTRAGSTLPLRPEEEELPPGEEGRTDYRLEFPLMEDTKKSGTSIQGAIRAVGAISEGGLDAVTVSGPFETDDVRRIFAVMREVGEPGAVVLNVGTRYFWSAHASEAQLAEYLATGDPAVGPDPDWDVGHFVGAAGTVQGAAGELVLICDTYPTLGPGGLHFQPIENVAHALRRPDIPGDGGLVLYLPSEAAAEARDRLAAQGFTIGMWDNGSPDALDAA